MQIDPEGRSGKWIADMMEYDLEIKPTILIKVQGFSKLMVESNIHALDINLIAVLSEEEEEDTYLQVSDMFISSPWYSDNVYVLQHLNPPPKVPKGKNRSLKFNIQSIVLLMVFLLERPRSCVAKSFGTKQSKGCDEIFSQRRLWWPSIL